MNLSLAVIALLIGDPIHSALEGMIGAVKVMKSACDWEPANISTSSGLTKMHRISFIAQGVISFVISQKEKHRYIPVYPLTIKLKIRSLRQL